MKEVFVNYWKQGMKVKCPDCDKKSKDPYKCKDHGEFKVKVKLSM